MMLKKCWGVQGNIVKQGEKNNIIVKTGGSENDIENFINLYKETTKRNKFKSLSSNYLRKLIHESKKEQKGLLFLAEYENKPLAAAIVIFFGDRATYFFGASSSKDREKMAPYKLHWEIIKYAKNKGYRWYDFWGISPDPIDKKHGWHHLSQFKRKFDGEQIDFIGAYDFVYNEKLYKQFLKESKEIPSVAL